VTAKDLEKARRLLCRLEDSIRETILGARKTKRGQSFSSIAAVTASDTIYHIDRVGEEAILAWFEKNWPRQWPVELVMEGSDENQPVTFPHGATVSDTVWKCIMDPIDGTRSIMYDKRSAWILAALAPQKDEKTMLSDVVVAAMSEIPTSKQWRADQISAVKGCGPKDIVAEMVDVFDNKRARFRARPSRATDFKHGFASLARFFPEGKSLLAKLEEDLWDELYGLGRDATPLIFDDQYICTGGQIYELLVGHDRMLGDLRPLVFQKLGFNTSVVCHPYDICTSMILTEAGVVVEAPDGGTLDVKLDTISPVTWMGYANEHLARQVRPILKRLIKKHLS